MTIKKILSSIEKHKVKTVKVFILCGVVNFFISTFYRIASNQSSRTQDETIINIYSLLVLTLILKHEFFNCFMFKFVTENFRMLTHYRGKGILLILISIIYMGPKHETQQNYSAYLLFFVGVILLVAQCKLDSEQEKSPFELAMERSKKRLASMGNSSIEVRDNSEVFSEKIEISESNCKTKNIETCETKPYSNLCKVSSNPYDIPDDF